MDAPHGRDIMIAILQMAIIKNAELGGWSVHRINDKQIEFTKKWCKHDNYDEICKNWIVGCTYAV